MINPQSTLKENYLVRALNIGLLFLLLFVLYKTLSAFLGVFTYAIIFSVTSFGLFEQMVTKLGNRRKLAGFIYGLLLVALVAAPLIYMVSVIINSFHGLHATINTIRAHQVPPLPEKIASLPVIGQKVQSIWIMLDSDPEKAIAMYGPQVRVFLQHMMTAGGGIVGAALELIIGIIIASVVLTTGGNKVVMPFIQILKTITGEKQGHDFAEASGKAIRGVAIGVMGTGLIAAVLAWAGYAIAGIPIAAVLAAITFFLVVIQVGPALVVIPVVIYLLQTGQTGWAIFVGVYGVVVLMSVDNILKPMLIARSGKLPVLVLFLGVVGGMAAWGFTGMFKGAIIMALFYTLVQNWVQDKASAVTTAPAAVA